MKKIVIFPPAEIEDYLLYLDWMRSLLALGYKVFAFEEDLNSLMKNLDNVKKKIEQISPDLIIGFNMYFLAFKVEMGVLFVSLFEVLEIPYISIVTDKIFRFCVGLKSPVRFFKFLRGIIVYDPVYKPLVKELLNVEVEYIPFIFPELTVDWDTIKFKTEVVLMDYSYEKKLDNLSAEFNTEKVIALKENLLTLLKENKGNSAFAVIPEQLKGTALCCFILEDCYYKYTYNYLSNLEDFLKSSNIAYTTHIDFKTLDSGIRLLRSYLGVCGVCDPYMSTELNRFVWFVARTGNLPLIPPKGALDTKYLNVVTELEELPGVIKKLSQRRVKIECFEQLFSFLKDKYSAIPWVAKGCEWMKRLL